MTPNNYAMRRAGSLKRSLTLGCLLFIAGLMIGCDQPADSTQPLGIAHRAPTTISDVSAQREAKVEHNIAMASATPAPEGPPEAERHESNGDDVLVRVRR